MVTVIGKNHENPWMQRSKAKGKNGTARPSGPRTGSSSRLTRLRQNRSDKPEGSRGRAVSPEFKQWCLNSLTVTRSPRFLSEWLSPQRAGRGGTALPLAVIGRPHEMPGARRTAKNTPEADPPPARPLWLEGLGGRLPTKGGRETREVLAFPSPHAQPGTAGHLRLPQAPRGPRGSHGRTEVHFPAHNAVLLVPGPGARGGPQSQGRALRACTSSGLCSARQ